MAAPTQDPLLYLFDDPSPEAVEMKPVLQELATEVLAKTYNDKITSLPTYQVLLKQSAAYKGRFVLALATAMHECVRRQDYRTRYALGEVLSGLMRAPLNLGEADYLRLFRLYGLDFSVIDHQARRTAVWGYPLGLTLGQVAKLARQQPPGDAMQIFLQQLLDYAIVTPGDIAKLIPKLQAIMLLEAGPNALPTMRFGDGDPFGDHLNQFVAALDRQAASTGPWLRLLLQWQKASGGQPTAKLRKELDAGAAAVGIAAVRQQASEWLTLLLAMPVVEQAHVHDYGNGTTYTHRTYDYLQESNAAVAKGLIWTMQPLADAPLRQQLADLAAKCYRKVPGKGPLAAGLGNACLLVLAQNGLPGVAALAQVRSKIKQTNTQELIGKYIQQASQTLGVSPAEIEDMAVPDFGLVNGQAEETLGDYTATLTLTDGKADVQWAKAEKPLKTAPAALKASHADELKELKSTQAQAQQTYAAQRDRLDRGFVEERRIAWPWFEQYYFNHGLMELLARPLIWRLHRPDGTFEDALWLAEAWRNVRGQPIPAPTADTQLQLWHPVLATPPEVLAWRELLERNQLRQPLKQAYREVYLLTPPEERTGTYSNRMAAHVLKQHQFNSLAKLRGWKYSLLGAYDKGYESDKATLALPTQQLRAEFWVSEVNADDAWNDTGIYLYISTDQVRFVRGEEIVPLPEIPALTFSEVMRDVDLFVGVASVGNDPLWHDNGGLVQYRDYWQNYSFGELGEVAKNRKLALERLVPRLKIGKVSELKDRFLVVRGKLRTYKIHLGSGNILMEPNDQYLCIVPDRSAKSATAADVFLPFEGDAVLSIILSKALLLMDDDKITDETIVRQIKQHK
jgi:hypothetical protein